MARKHCGGHGLNKLRKRKQAHQQARDATDVVRGVLRAPAERKDILRIAERPCPSCTDPTTEPCPTCGECPACCLCEDLEMVLYDNEAERWNRGDPLKPWNG